MATPRPRGMRAQRPGVFVPAATWQALTLTTLLGACAAAQAAPSSNAAAQNGGAAANSQPTATLVAQAVPTAANGARAYDIAPGTLGDTLARYAAASGVQLVFDPALLAGRQSPGLRGSFGVQAGFDRLLGGSGWRAVPRGAGVYDLQAVPAGPAVTELDAVTVIGNADQLAQTEGSNSYTSRAVTIGKGGQTLKEIPQSASVVTRKQLDDQNLNNLSDAMRNVTGITVETLSSGGNISNFISRGYALDTIMVDGISMPAGAGNLSTGFDLAIYDRIEVLRGPSGLYQGSGEPGGSINLVRKRPLDKFGFSAQTTVGSWDYYRAVTDLSTPFDEAGKVRGRFIAAYEHRGSFIDRVDAEHPTLYGVIEADLTPATTLTAGITWQRDHSRPSFGLPAYADGSLLDVKRSTNVSAQWNRLTEETTETFANLEHRLANGGAIKASVFHRDTDTPTRLMTWANSAVDPATGDTSVIGWSYRNHWQTTGTDVNLNLPFTAFGREHSVLVGADYTYTRKAFSYGGGTTYATNIYDPVRNMPDPDFDRVNGNESRTSQLGLYTRFNFQVMDKLKWIAGSRLSWWRNDARNNNTYFDDFSQNTDRVSAHITPYTGLIYDLTPELSAYASYTSIFQPQTDTTAQGSTLKPRTGKQYEIGLKGEYLDGRLNTHAALFRMEDRNRAMADPDDPMFSVAAGKVRSEGFETEISGSPLPGWDLVAGYAYTHTKYLDADVGSQGTSFSSITPRHTFNLWTKYAFSQESLRGFSVGAGVRVNSGFYEEENDTRWNQGTYTVVSAQVGYRYNRHLDTTLTVNNLFDRKYYEKLGGASRQNYYGAPRSVMLNVRYQY
ncbi:TonB-dependent receptor [Bordetella sp. N]|uniref:TonB-dependent siderophore receptor n=1 Tax=Bordetella sp. N TaxID=1746199 RepID=UPI000B219CDC|nr:TonB-dependent receptor [Bordetella sp. N]